MSKWELLSMARGLYLNSVNAGICQYENIPAMLD